MKSLTIRLHIIMLLLSGIVLHAGECFAAGREDKTSDSLLRALANVQSDTTKIRIYEQLAEVYEKTDYQRSLEALDKMYRLSKRNDHRRGMIRAAMLKGRMHVLMQRPDSAIDWLRMYFRLETEPAKEEAAKACNNLGMAYYHKQQFDSSLHYYDKSISLYRASGKSSADLCAVINNLGLTTYQTGNPEKSYDYFREAYQCMLKEGVTENLGRVINNLASVSSRLGKNNADSLFFAVLERHGSDLDPVSKATVYYNLGSFYFHAGEPDKAKQYALIADSLDRKAGVESNPDVLHLLGNIASNRHQYDEALTYYRKILHVKGSPQDMELLYKNMARTFYAAEQYDSSRHYYEKIIELNDSLNRLKTEEALQKAQESLQLYKKESEIRKLELERDLLEAKRENATLIAVSLGALVLLLLILARMYSRKEKEKRKAAREELKRKQERLAGLSEQIARKNEVIDHVEQQLKQYDQEEKIREELKADIIKTLNVQGDWDAFARFFEDQHKGFYAALKNKSQELTDHELRICSLSKMRLSLKETAGILHVSVDAVKSARYRIRKKLGLPSDETLSDFLNSL